MKNRSGSLRGWKTFLLLAFLAVPLLGWNALPKSVHSVNLRDSPAARKAVLQPITAQNSPARNVEKGRDLFMGTIHLENGGPPCMGCHNIGNNGILGGGAMGPDLTNVSTRRSQPELQTILSNSDAAMTPIMRPIYAEHPLTTAEQADLLAFINASVGQPETNREWLVIAIALTGFLGVLGLIELVYHRRLHGIRKPMIKEALKNNK